LGATDYVEQRSSAIGLKAYRFECESALASFFYSIASSAINDPSVSRRAAFLSEHEQNAWLAPARVMHMPGRKPRRDPGNEGGDWGVLRRRLNKRPDHA
jgi:hypothetical protein